MIAMVSGASIAQYSTPPEYLISVFIIASEHYYFVDFTQMNHSQLRLILSAFEVDALSS